jgi:transposase
MVREKSSEAIIRDIMRQTKRKFSSEEKISIVIEALRGEDSIASICKREGAAPSVYYR